MKTMVILSVAVFLLLSACVSTGPSIEGPEFAYMRELAGFTSFDYEKTLELLAVHKWSVMSDKSLNEKIRMILARSGRGEIMSIVFLGDRIYRIEMYRDIRKGAFREQWKAVAALVKKYYNPEADVFLDNVNTSDETDLLAKIAANDGSISIGTVMKTAGNPVFTCVPRVKSGSVILFITYENEALVGETFGT
jgi:hypothetical protein